ncbi:MAG: hypothetical protein ACOYD4_01300 [Solirubrobacterales bacterium]
MATMTEAELPLFEQFLPSYDVSDTIAVSVEASVAETWRALTAVDLVEVGRRRKLVGLLGFLRGLPEIASRLLRRQALRPTPKRLTLHEMADPDADNGDWVLLGERAEDELALGLVGRFWRPLIEFAPVDPGSFSSFSRPGYAKTIYALRVRDAGDGATLLTGTMRTATTDDRSRRLFDRYWTFGVGSGAHVLVRGLLEVVKEDAEADG